MKEHFGEHLMIDAYGCDEIKLDSKSSVANVISEIVTATNMKQLSKIEVYEVEGVPNTKDSGGVTGMVIINESHISIHTFPKRQYVSIDIFTCKNGMDVEKIKNLCKFGFEKVNHNWSCDATLIKRGLNFPESDIVK